jgi:hypothetical protein
MPLKTMLTTLASLLILGCSSDDTPTGNANSTGRGATAATPDEALSTCDAICGRDVRCATPDNPVSPTCQSNCAADFSKPEVYRSDALAAMRNCFAALGCTGGDDSCTTQAILATSTNPLADPGYLSCKSRYDACNASAPGNFSDDICSWRLTLTAAVQAPLDACLALACTEVNACIDALLGQN